MGLSRNPKRQAEHGRESTNVRNGPFEAIRPRQHDPRCGRPPGTDPAWRVVEGRPARAASGSAICVLLGSVGRDRLQAFRRAR